MLRDTQSLLRIPYLLRVYVPDFPFPFYFCLDRLVLCAIEEVLGCVRHL